MLREESLYHTVMHERPQHFSQVDECHDCKDEEKDDFADSDSTESKCADLLHKRGLHSISEVDHGSSENDSFKETNSQMQWTSQYPFLFFAADFQLVFDLIQIF